MKDTQDSARFLLIGYAVPMEDFEASNNVDAYSQIQGVKFMWRIINGLELALGMPVDLVGAVPASDYPRNPNILFRFKHWKHELNADDYVIPFINLFLLKHVTRCFSTIALLSYWLIKNRNRGSRYVLIYAMHSPYLLAAVMLKVMFRFKTVTIVPDLPAFMNEGIRLGFSRKIAKRIDAFMMRKILHCMDGLVVLTKQAANDIAGPVCKSLIVEGAVSVDELVELPKRSMEGGAQKKIVMFTGALVGLEILLQAFEYIDEEIFLYITGRGPMEEAIRVAARRDNRISYFGLLGKKELREKMSEATAFLNVRSSTTPNIQYSFPSKVLEYMATGRPTISTVLPGIPDEYHDYLYLLHDETAESLAALIVSVCNKSELERDQFGCKSREFVVQKKNYKIQGRRIYDFVLSL